MKLGIVAELDKPIIVDSRNTCLLGSQYASDSVLNIRNDSKIKIREKSKEFDKTTRNWTKSKQRLSHVKTTHGGSNRFVRRPGEGRTSGTAYDTAWTARIMDETCNPVFPECLKWVLVHQKSDGSWGSDTLNYHDRIISTLSAVMALREIDGEKYEKYIHRGEEFIWENLENLKKDSHRLIGSELLLHSLMQQAESMELNVPHQRKVYQKEYAMKLGKIDESLWYSPLTTLSFSLEFLGDEVDIHRLPHVQLPNGSVANSPATTAFFLKHKKDARALAYLREILELSKDGSVMALYPIDIFEYGWIMYNLILAHLYFERYHEVSDFLLSNLKNSSVGCSTDSPLTDADDTAVVCKVLEDMNYSIDYQIFDEYYTGEYYQTFNFELDPSVSTNIHMLDLVRSCPEFPDRDEIIEHLLKFLKKNIFNGFWRDKWHISPYYPTSHAIFALCDIDLSLSEKAVSWIQKSQNQNGMWGENDGTLEETSYAIQALMYYNQHESIDLEGVSKALLTIDSAVPTNVLDDLWIGKVLYCPTNVVLSSLMSASFMYKTTEWDISSMWGHMSCEVECHVV